MVISISTCTAVPLVFRTPWSATKASGKIIGDGGAFVDGSLAGKKKEHLLSVHFCLNDKH
jgi:hypothetical protein